MKPLPDYTRKSFSELKFTLLVPTLLFQSILPTRSPFGINLKFLTILFYYDRMRQIQEFLISEETRGQFIRNLSKITKDLNIQGYAVFLSSDPKNAMYVLGEHGSNLKDSVGKVLRKYEIEAKSGQGYVENVNSSPA